MTGPRAQTRPLCHLPDAPARAPAPLSCCLLFPGEPLSLVPVCSEAQGFCQDRVSRGLLPLEGPAELPPGPKCLCVLSLRTEAWRAAGIQAQASLSCQGGPQPPARGGRMLDVGLGTDVCLSFRCPIFAVIASGGPRGAGSRRLMALGEPGLGVSVSGVTSPCPHPRGRGLERRQTHCSFLSAGPAPSAQELDAQTAVLALMASLPALLCSSWSRFCV